MPGIDIDVSGFTDVQVVAAPLPGPVFGGTGLDPGIVAAGNDQAREVEPLLEPCRRFVKASRIGRGDEQRAKYLLRSLEAGGDRGEAAKAVGDDPDGFANALDFTTDAGGPLGPAGALPIVLFDPVGVGELLLEPGLPMRGPAVAQAGNDQDFCHEFKSGRSLSSDFRGRPDATERYDSYELIRRSSGDSRMHIDMQISSFGRRIGFTMLGGKFMVRKLDFPSKESMADDMNTPMAESPGLATSAEAPVFSVAEAVNKLPTLQRNALRKIFDRHEFLPEEVAMLGYRRLQQAEGIGNKGLAAITAWLLSYGFELKPLLPVDASNAPVRSKSRRSIERAVRLLKTHGYEVVRQVATGAKQREGSA